MAPAIASKYFKRIKRIWQPLPGGRRIIPFCTPIIHRPRVLVIGINHSDFVKGGGAEAERIADQLAARVPTASTFLLHAHQFAQGLHAVCGRAGIKIDERWVGTNRCAVQTGSAGIKELQKFGATLRACQNSMDEVLLELIQEIKPRNVLLLGRYPSRLFFPSTSKLKDLNLSPLEIRTGRTMTRIIALPHPSYAPTWKIAAQRLKEQFAR
jgi:hypothetical protein